MSDSEQDPDQAFHETDPRIRIRIKIKQIRNTEFYNKIVFVSLFCKISCFVVFAVL